MVPASTHRAGRPSPPYPPMPMPEPEVPNDREERLRRRASARPRYPTPPPVEGTLADAIRPMTPPSRAVFGPSGERPRTPLRNPLPEPPRDLYEMSPYRSLLTLPQTTALLTANFGTQNGTGTGLNRANTIVVHPNGVTKPFAMPTAAPEIKKRKTLKGGLLRAFSRKEKSEPPPQEANPIYIPVFVPKAGEGGVNGSQNHSTSHLPQPFEAQADDLSRSMSQSQNQNHNRRRSVNVGAPPISPTRSGDSDRSSMLPVPPMPMNPPVIRFDQDGQYNFFMNHSPHAVVYQNKRYPTALHLHEALKFIGHQDTIAEEIRGQDIWDVYPYASQYQDHVRPDWNDTYLDFVCSHFFVFLFFPFTKNFWHRWRRSFSANLHNMPTCAKGLWPQITRSLYIQTLVTASGARDWTIAAQMNSERRWSASVTKFEEKLSDTRWTITLSGSPLHYRLDN